MQKKELSTPKYNRYSKYQSIKKLRKIFTELRTVIDTQNFDQNQGFLKNPLSSIFELESNKGLCGRSLLLIPDSLILVSTVYLK